MNQHLIQSSHLLEKLYVTKHPDAAQKKNMRISIRYAASSQVLSYLVHEMPAPSPWLVVVEMVARAVRVAPQSS
jgi:hypothetical protein